MRHEVSSAAWRHIGLASLCLLCLVNEMQWITFSPVISKVKAFYRVEDNAVVDLLSMVYMIVYVAMVPVTCLAFRWLPRVELVVLLAAVLNGVGSVVKIPSAYAANPSIGDCFASQTLNACSQLLIIAVPPVVSRKWLPPERRVFGAALITSSFNLGVAFGMLVPPLLVREGEDEAGRRDELGNQFAQLYWLEFALSCAAVVGLVATSVMMSQGGRTGRVEDAPSRSGIQDVDAQLQVTSEVEEEADRVGGGASAWTSVVCSVEWLKQHRRFLYFSLIGGIQNGLSWAMSTVFAQVHAPFHISEASAGWLGFANVISGTLAAPLIGWLLDTSRHHTRIVLAFSGVLLASQFLVLGVMANADAMEHTTLLGLCYLGWILSGIAQSALLPLLYDAAVESALPRLPESQSSPFLSWNVCWITLVLIGVFSSVIGNTPSVAASVSVMIIASGCCFLSLCLALLVLL